MVQHYIIEKLYFTRNQSPFLLRKYLIVAFLLFVRILCQF